MSLGMSDGSLVWMSLEGQTLKATGGFVAVATGLISMNRKANEKEINGSIVMDREDSLVGFSR